MKPSLLIVLSAVLFSGFLIGCQSTPTTTDTSSDSSQALPSQIKQAQSNKAPLLITQIQTSPSGNHKSADVKIDFVALSRIPIQQVTFKAKAYNSSNQLAGNSKTKSFYAEGPFYKGAKGKNNKWKNAWNSDNVSCSAIEAVEITFLNNKKKTYTGQALLDLISQEQRNQCGQLAATLASTSNTPGKTGPSQISPAQVLTNLPPDNGGIYIKVPDQIANGKVVPINLTFAKPLLPGDKLIISGEGEKALELTTQSHALSGISARLRLDFGRINTYIIRANGVINSSARKVAVNLPAGEPLAIGNGVLEKKVRYQGNQVKMLFKNQMATQGHIKTIKVLTGNGGPITLKLTPRISMNPYFGITAVGTFSSVSVQANM